MLQASAGETCDGSAGSVGTGCRTDCTSCGDGILQAGAGETCDGTAGAVGTGCRADCTSCGDGIVQASDGEVCDFADPNAPPGCSSTGPGACTIPTTQNIPTLSEWMQIVLAAFLALAGLAAMRRRRT
ncbi:MAG: hypothetical protein DMD83_15735 [Candidatus Rokuibacteriota bacterium]|nr:MAG: hypothetical protein DMD83_15735 [Candidatus Rokubacteria bacterium]